MPSDDKNTHPSYEAKEIRRKARRRQRAKRRGDPAVWYGLSMFGLIGWAVAVPTVAGVALGLWLDANYPSGMSWTLALLLGGAALGCFNALYWLQKESRDD